MADGGTPVRRGLVVESDPATREWLAGALASAFGVIDVAAFGALRESMAWLRRQPSGPVGGPLSIALIDLVLPDGSGINLIREISRNHPNVAPVVVSIHADDGHIFDAISAGAQGYLLKDERSEHLIQHLRDIDHGEPPLSPSIARRILSHFQKRAPDHARTGRPDILLTTRERQVLGLLGRGLRLSDAAAELGLTRHTVAGYVKIIYSKLDISSRAEAAVEAMRRGLI